MPKRKAEEDSGHIVPEITDDIQGDDREDLLQKRMNTANNFKNGVHKNPKTR